MEIFMEDTNQTENIFNRRANAAAFLSGNKNYPEIKGRVFFYQLKESVLVCAEFTGLPKKEEPCQNPVFAFHIHEGKTCTGNSEDPFADTGGHYNPHGCQHPYHAGDLPPLFGVNGKAFSAFVTDRFRVSEILGRTVILHAHPDDFSTQPSGNAGEKIACGVIKEIR